MMNGVLDRAAETRRLLEKAKEPPQPPVLECVLRPNSELSKPIPQEWLCWYPRSNDVWWPALRFPSIKEAHRKLIPNPHKAQKRATRAWTLASLQEIVMKEEYPNVAVFLDDTRIEWHPTKDVGLIEADFTRCYSFNDVPADQAEAWRKANIPAFAIMMSAEPTAPEPTAQEPTAQEPTAQESPSPETARPSSSAQIVAPEQEAPEQERPVVVTARTAAPPRVSTDTQGRLSPSASDTALECALAPAAPTSSPVTLRNPNVLFPPSSTNSPNDDDTNKPNAENGFGRPNTDPDWIPKLEAELDVHAPWSEAWEVLEFSGYTKILVNLPSGAVQTRYVKPGVQTARSRPDVGYFTDEYDIQEFCRQAYHWQGPTQSLLLTQPHEDHDEEEEEEESDEESHQGMDEGENQLEEVVPHPSSGTVVSGLTNPTSCHTWATPPDHLKTQPQDPAKPQLPSPASWSQSTHSFETHDDLLYYIKRHGWTVSKGKGLVDWVYIKPGRKYMGGVENIDYFTDHDKLVDYLLGTSQTAQGTKRGRETNDTGISKKKAASKRASKGNDAKVAKISTKTVGHSSSSPAEKRKRQNSLGSSTPKPRHLNVSGAVHMLKKIGIQQNGKQQWELTVKKTDTVLSFVSLTGLRKFLCNQGIPNEYFDKAKSKLTESQLDRFLQWVCFANVPLAAHETERALKKYKAPKNDRELQNLLCGNIERVDSRYYLPNALRGKHKVGSDCFDEKDLTTEFRKALRGVPLWVKTPWSALDPRKKDHRLRLLLWAAQCNSDLVEFNAETAVAVHRGEEYQTMEEDSYNQQVGCEHDNGEDGSSTGDATEPTNASSRALTDVSSKSNSSKKKATKKPRHEKPQWYDGRPSWELVWPILEKLGYHRDSSDPDKYVHEEINVPGGLTQEQLRVGIVFCGVPSYEPKTNLYKRRRGLKPPDTAKVEGVDKGKVEGVERDLLLRWANFAHFPDNQDPSTQEQLLLKIDTMFKGRAFDYKKEMMDLGFQTESQNFYPPNSDEHKKAIQATDRVKGLHVLPGKASVVEFLRSAPCLNLLMPETEPQEHFEKGLFLRIWAMREAVDFDLPSFYFHPERLEFFLQWCQRASD